MNCLLKCLSSPRLMAQCYYLQMIEKLAEFRPPNKLLLLVKSALNNTIPVQFDLWLILKEIELVSSFFLLLPSSIWQFIFQYAICSSSNLVCHLNKKHCFCLIPLPAVCKNEFHFSFSMKSQKFFKHDLERRNSNTNSSNQAVLSKIQWLKLSEGNSVWVSLSQRDKSARAVSN